MPNILSMTIRPIVIHGDPVLHEPTKPVEQPVAELQELIADMHETMDAAYGVGLAANQVGVPLRLFVYHCPDGDRMRRGTVINPVLETSEVPKTMPSDDGDDDEGCLSVPGESWPTGRASWAKVTGLDENGDEVVVEGEGFFARCLQHEVGHLDGFVYTDVLTGRYKREAKRVIRDNGWNTPGNTWLPGTDEDPFGH
ncbi:peptide deformylase [Corynebacterium sanguinis]|nr:peptide deformylase [Corynebacterium sanguinis]